MKNRFVGILLGAVLATGLGMVLTPSKADAVLITSINVTVRTTTFCQTGGGCANPIWNLGAGVNLTTGQSLIVTQTSGFNFDSSEPGGVACTAANPCPVTIAINGVTVANALGANPINNFNGEPVNPPVATHNEAANWAQAFNGGLNSYTLSLGYADNIHTDACADTTGTVANNCLPDNPWQGSANTTFIGAGTTGVGSGVIQGGANHCSVTVASTTCFDGGALLITANALTTTTTPEPSALFLLGSGLVGIVSMIRRKYK